MDGTRDERDAFETWFAERPKWLQTAAADLNANRRLPDSSGVSRLADLCIAEANSLSGTVFLSMPNGVFGTDSATAKVKLKKLEGVVGVNAIKENASLAFGDADISVVFGMNGSGKSGFSRLLKHVCGARAKSGLLPNVFASDPKKPSCKVVVDLNDKSITFPWELGSSEVRELRSIHVFDTEAANSYLDLNNEASYEPRRMRFLSALIRICDSVSAELSRRKLLLPKALTAVPSEHMGTQAATFVAKLRHDISASSIDAACAWSQEDSNSRHEIEAALKESDLSARLNQLAIDRRSLSATSSLIGSLKSALSDSAASNIIHLRSDAAVKRKAASEDAAAVFKDAAFDGIGAKSWRLLWEQARAYSEESAYPNSSFPSVNAGDRCVLCHQELDANAMDRLGKFEAFVKGGLEASASLAEADLAKALTSLPSLPNRTHWELSLQSLGIDIETASALLDSVADRLLGLQTSESIGAIKAVDFRLIDEKISARSSALNKEELSLIELQKDGRREQLGSSLKELRAREWLSHQKGAIASETERLALLREIERAEAIAKTNALTLKKNDLARDELASGYRERFASELRALGGGRLKVEPVPISEGKGKVSFKISIKEKTFEAVAGNVLSEGESRIVALAAFLADATGSGQPTPFIFDDPVSSLDQEFEERVVERLVTLAKARQVIIFTHRLSLLALVEDAISAEKRKAADGDSFPELAVVTLRRFGDLVGHVDDLDVRHKKPRAGFVSLRDHKLPRIRKDAISENVANYEAGVKAVCGDIRILIERTVEKVMLNGVLERFRRSITTQQIGSLAKINSDDCALIDTMMSRYSRFEHSQPDELAGTLPTPDELEGDLNQVIAWLDEFSQRTA